MLKFIKNDKKATKLELQMALVTIGNLLASLLKMQPVYGTLNMRTKA